MEKVSIIIPCVEVNYRTKKCIRECLKLDYEDFEIIVLPDKFDKKVRVDKLKIIETGMVKPAFKRNKGMEIADGNFFAFIDDDAYPRKDWLRNAINYFRDERIGIVGGPNLTPIEAGFKEIVSGYVLSNFFVLGPASIRYKINNNRYVKELPSCNYISRNLGIKYDDNFLTAEDSKYCFDFAKKGYKLLYANNVIVYHHRRDNFFKHIKQIYIYGRDIAWLSKKEFSYDKLYYSLPSLGFLIFIFGLIGMFYSEIIRFYFPVLIGVYLLLMLFNSFHDNFKTSLFVFTLSVLSHFAYGIGYLIGMFSYSEKNEEVIWNSR